MTQGSRVTETTCEAVIETVIAADVIDWQRRELPVGVGAVSTWRVLLAYAGRLFRRRTVGP
jgi:hypothetical protein